MKTNAGDIKVAGIVGMADINLKRMVALAMMRSGRDMYGNKMKADCGCD